MATDLYTPLDPTITCIRLLMITNTKHDDTDIHCRFFESDLDQAAVPYKALSYTWGELEHPTGGGAICVYINGHKVSVKETLFSALYQIRSSSTTDVILWVDALCINQGDPAEKAHQIRQMGKVYAIAEEVLIWLGPGNDNIKSLMDLINWVHGRALEAAIESREDWVTLYQQAMKEPPAQIGFLARDKQAEGFQELVTRHWFKRVWVLQEVANASLATIMCGSSSCPAKVFPFMQSVLSVNVDEHAQAVLDIMPQSRKGTWWSSRRDLHFLLQKFERSNASLPRDKVYALLGISEDADIEDRFLPCYNEDDKPDGEVYRDTASFVLFKEILGPEYSFPDFTFADLCVPLIQLLEKTLLWALSTEYSGIGTVGNTARLIVDRLNEGEFKTGDLLLSLAENHAPHDGHRLTQLSNGSVEFSVVFSDDGTSSTLTITPKNITPRNAGTPPLHLNFSRQQIEPDPELPLPSFLSNKNEDITEVIDRLTKTGAPKDEILRAYAWAGDQEQVRRQLDEGADVNGKGIDGLTALHHAARRDNAGVIRLLLGAGADVNARTGVDARTEVTA